jgi:hypothetical protein
MQEKDHIYIGTEAPSAISRLKNYIVKRIVGEVVLEVPNYASDAYILPIELRPRLWKLYQLNQCLYDKAAEYIASDGASHPFSSPCNPPRFKTIKRSKKAVKSKLGAAKHTISFTIGKIRN